MEVYCAELLIELAAMLNGSGFFLYTFARSVIASWETAVNSSIAISNWYSTILVPVEEVVDADKVDVLARLSDFRLSRIAIISAEYAGNSSISCSFSDLKSINRTPR